MSKTCNIVVNGQSYEVLVLSQTRNRTTFTIEGRNYEVEFEAAVSEAHVAKPHTKKTKRSMTNDSIRRNIDDSADGITTVRSPIPGVVLNILVAVGEQVVEGDILIKIEAMKMENNIFAPTSGKIRNILVDLNSEVKDSQALIEIS